MIRSRVDIAPDDTAPDDTAPDDVAPADVAPDDMPMRQLRAKTRGRREATPCENARVCPSKLADLP